MYIELKHNSHICWLIVYDTYSTPNHLHRYVTKKIPPKYNIFVVFLNVFPGSRHTDIG